MCVPAQFGYEPPLPRLLARVFLLGCALIVLSVVLMAAGCGPDISSITDPHRDRSGPFRCYGAGCGLSRAVVESHYPDDTAYLDRLCRLPSGRWMLKTKLSASPDSLVYDGPVDGMGVLGSGRQRPVWSDVLTNPEWREWHWYYGIDYLFPLAGGEARPVTGITGPSYRVTACGQDENGVWVQGIERW
jgi:hypothetical protein